jgi:hypothetical protein
VAPPAPLAPVDAELEVIVAPPAPPDPDVEPDTALLPLATVPLEAEAELLGEPSQVHAP